METLVQLALIFIHHLDRHETKTKQKMLLMVYFIKKHTALDFGHKKERRKKAN